MSLFAIADTHLSFGTDKPMDSFQGWNDYTERLKNNWNKVVNDNDIVVIAGDISWAMNFEELYADFDFINNLNGQKIILKGNHDYWWNTLNKMNNFIKDNSFDTISILQNNSFTFDNISICGSRGWLFESEDDHDEKILKRELQRIQLSLNSAQTDEKLLFLHYPPITSNLVCNEIIDLLKQNGIKKCYYGHLHGVAAKFAIDDVVDGIEFHLISCDRLSFTPKLIKKF